MQAYEARTTQQCTHAVGFSEAAGQTPAFYWPSTGGKKEKTKQEVDVYFNFIENIETNRPIEDKQRYRGKKWIKNGIIYENI